MISSIPQNFRLFSAALIVSNGCAQHRATSPLPPKRASAAEILAHSSYPDAIWKLTPTQKGRLPVAVGRGGPILIDWEVHGHGERKVVWVIGLGGIKSGYQRQTHNFGHIQEDKYSCLILDNRGIGKSDKPLSRYSTSAMAQDIIEVLEHLGWTSHRQLNIVGVSMGGMIAQELAFLIPARISSLALFSTAAFIENQTTFYENMLTRLQMFIPKSLDRSLVDASRMMFAPSWLDEADNAVVPAEGTPKVEFPSSDDGEGKRAYKKFTTNYERWASQELTKKTDPNAFGKKGFIMQAIAAGWHHKSPEQLKKIGDEVGRERIAILHGDIDRMIHVHHGKKLIEWLQPGRSVIKEGTGHVFFMEHTKWHDEYLEKLWDDGETLNQEEKDATANETK